VFGELLDVDNTRVDATSRVKCASDYSTDYTV
jgi:hypothetical protein